jgi:hypothetical protein
VGEGVGDQRFHAEHDRGPRGESYRGGC